MPRKCKAKFLFLSSFAPPTASAFPLVIDSCSFFVCKTSVICCKQTISRTTQQVPLNKIKHGKIKIKKEREGRGGGEGEKTPNNPTSNPCVIPWLFRVILLLIVQCIWEGVFLWKVCVQSASKIQWPPFITVKCRFIKYLFPWNKYIYE